jgi:hypothetical protein
MAAMTRRTIPLLITFFFGLFPLVDYFIKNAAIGSIASFMGGVAASLLNFAFVLSVLTLIITNARKAVTGGEGMEAVWAGITAVVCVITIVLGVGMGTSDPNYQFIIANIRDPPEKGMMVTMLLFWISSYYRVIRIRNFETLLATFAFFVVVITAVPIGAMIPGSAWLKDFILVAFHTPVMQSIRIGASIGAIILGIRVLLGRERGYLREATGG